MQQINFLKTLAKTSRQISASLIVWIVLTAFAILLLISFIVGVFEFQVDQLLEVSKKTLITSQNEYEKISKAYPLLATDIPLADQVHKLERAYKAKKDELDSLEYLIIRRGFSEYMLDLAEITPNTLWLNEIHINHQSDNITLSGYSTHPDAVSDFMSRLLSTSAYKNVIFNLFFVKSIKNHPYVKFSIATKELGSEEEKIVEKTDQTSQKPKE
jgi:Tfp pilus assembly protein PilN